MTSMRDTECKKAFYEIYQNTYKKVYAAVLSGTADAHTAEDIFQEIYAELYNALKSGKSVHNPQSYLMTVVRKKLSRHYKSVKRAREREVSSEDDTDITELAADDFEIEDSIVTAELYREISARLKAKSEIVQHIFVMFYQLEMTIPEIAESLSVSQSFVKNKLYRTLKEFRKLYGEEDL